jgi:CheY-like chemotaxis protein
MATILIIDDEASQRETLTDMLEEAGYLVATARDGKEGLRRCQAQPVDLVLTDMLMPGQEGFETIRALRAVRPGVTIIAISGGGHFGQKTLLEMAMHLGADRALQKPIRHAELLATVREVLGEGDAAP